MATTPTPQKGVFFRLPKRTYMKLRRLVAARARQGLAVKSGEKRATQRDVVVDLIDAAPCP